MLHSDSLRCRIIELLRFNELLVLRTAHAQPHTLSLCCKTCASFVLYLFAPCLRAHVFPTFGLGLTEIASIHHRGPKQLIHVSTSPWGLGK